MNENYYILIQISPIFSLECSNNNKLALVHMMAWSQTGNKPLSEPMMTEVIDAYMHHLVLVN